MTLFVFDARLKAAERAGYLGKSERLWGTPWLPVWSTAL
jgi:hypothetical protein